MKVIDAINKINKEEKFRFRLLCDGDIYKYIGGSLYNETVGERAEWIIDNLWLNQEIEIIEEDKKIERLGLFDLTIDKNEKDKNGKKLELNYTGVADTFDKIYIKINEIIDKMNELEEDRK